MNTLELKQFSEEVEGIVKAHKNFLGRLLLRAKFCWRFWRNEPMCFFCVEGDEGTPVGNPMEVVHLSLHDMAPHMICGDLTTEVMLRGRRANAFSVVNYEQLEEMVARTTIQPRWI